MICDVCNAQTTKEQGVLISPERFRQLLRQGFGIDETNIQMLTDAGMPRDVAITALTQYYSDSRSFWLLCANCAAQAEKYL